MKKLAVILYTALMKRIRRLRWRIQSRNINVSLVNATEIECELNQGGNKKILVVVPHSDDELIGCYSIVKKYCKNTVVWYSGMTGDDTTELNKSIRKQELLDFCRKMGVEAVVCNGDIKEELQQTFYKYRPGYVFAPSVIDWHQEHRKLFLSVADVLRDTDAQLYCYQVTVPIPQKYITHYSELTKEEHKTKWQVFKDTYISQKFMPVLRLKLSEMVYTKEKEKIRAEVFMKYEPRDHISENKNLENLNRIKIHINDLKKIRIASGKEYGKMFSGESRMIGIGEIQAIETQMLEFIDKVCKENNITYYIHAGSALGAIRHGGPIPWDDDVDIIVPITELDNMVDVLNKNMPEEYRLYNKEENEYNQILFPRLCLNNNHPMTAYIDIFPLVGLPDDRKKQIAFSKRADLINKYYKLRFKNVRETRNILKRLAVFVLKQFACLIPFSCWQSVFDKHINKYPYENAKYVMNPCGMKGIKNIIEKSIYGTPVYVKYSGLELPIANKYDEYLKHYYGDYMKYPDESIVQKGLNVKKQYNSCGEK